MSPQTALERISALVKKPHGWPLLDMMVRLHLGETVTRPEATDPAALAFRLLLAAQCVYLAGNQVRLMENGHYLIMWLQQQPAQSQHPPQSAA